MSENNITKDKFTPRELQVLELLSKGYSNNKIAKELSIEVTTVKAHIKKIMLKMQVANRLEIVISVFKNKFFDE